MVISNPLPIAGQSPASAWVQRFMSLIPKNSAPVLDLACGSGRHTRLLLDAGYEVWALDKELSLLEPLVALGARPFQIDLEINFEQQDKTYWPFEPAMFAGIVVTNYLHRPLFPHIKSALADQGVLIYETFCDGNAAFGRPQNPDFLLRAGELLKLSESDPKDSQQNYVIAYEQGYIDVPHPAMVQRICLRTLRKSAENGQGASLDRI